MKKKLIINIAIVAAVAALIVVIWLFKNRPFEKKLPQDDVGLKPITESNGSFEKPKPIEEPSESEGNGNSNSEKDETIPGLDVTEIDLKKLKSYELPLVIDFGSASCPPCVKMRPTLELLHEEMKEKAVIIYVDTKYNRQGKDAFPVRVTPTQFIFTSEGMPYIPSENIDIAGFITYSDKTTSEHVYTAHEGYLSEEDFRKILSDLGIL